MNEIEREQEKKNKDNLTKTYIRIGIIFVATIIGLNLIGLIIHLITK